MRGPQAGYWVPLVCWKSRETQTFGRSRLIISKHLDIIQAVAVRSGYYPNLIESINEAIIEKAQYPIRAATCQKTNEIQYIRVRWTVGFPCATGILLRLGE